MQSIERLEKAFTKKKTDYAPVLSKRSIKAVIKREARSKSPDFIARLNM
jgi:hypothetical protein